MCFCEVGTESFKHNVDRIFTLLLSEGRAETLPTNSYSYLSLLGNKVCIASPIISLYLLCYYFLHLSFLKIQ